MPAVLFGSIGTLADTSELQREAFNDAFREHGLDWHWSREEYRRLLHDSGGAKRIAAYAQTRGEDVDAAAVHGTKSEIFREKLRASPVTPRPGLVDTIDQIRGNGYQLALVTTTSAENITALATAMRPQVDLDGFDLVVDNLSVQRSKPDPEAYRFALARLDEKPDACLAVEDNAGGVQAAVTAGLTCVAFPGENTVDHRFDGATERIDELAFAELRTLFPTV